VELLPSEQQAGVKGLLDKVAQYRPHVVCLANLTLAEYVRKAIARVNSFHLLLLSLMRSKALKRLEVSHTLVGPAAVGIQRYSILFAAPGTTSGLKEVIFYATPSTSGLVTQYQVCI